MNKQFCRFFQKPPQRFHRMERISSSQKWRDTRPLETTTTTTKNKPEIEQQEQQEQKQEQESNKNKNKNKSNSNSNNNNTNNSSSSNNYNNNQQSATSNQTTQRPNKPQTNNQQTQTNPNQFHQPTNQQITKPIKPPTSVRISKMTSQTKTEVKGEEATSRRKITSRLCSHRNGKWRLAEFFAFYPGKDLYLVFFDLQAQFVSVHVKTFVQWSLSLLPLDFFPLLARATGESQRLTTGAKYKNSSYGVPISHSVTEVQKLFIVTVWPKSQVQVQVATFSNSSNQDLAHRASGNH